ncbi:MAG: putative bifunctional diguanylate cyclase/phosphodiesterase, partial [Nitrospiria bacterium]
EAEPQRADVAMYEAKQTRSGYKVYNAAQDRHSTGRLALMGELRHAIEEKQLLLHYQPKVNLQTNRITGVEALVRWQHPKLGMVPPVQFILPAEQTGMIKSLTQWVLQEALSQSRRWQQDGLRINLSVNLSARNLQDTVLPGQIARLLQTYGITPSSLEVEITESAIMTDEKHARDVLTEIGNMGISISIDDFGMGYSSLSYIKKLAVNRIKIDKSFVESMSVNHDDEVIVRSTINLGHNLGLKVVAEGVENQETWNRLVALGCDEAQGYYMKRPAPAEELTRWMNEKRSSNG